MMTTRWKSKMGVEPKNEQEVRGSATSGVSCQYQNKECRMYGLGRIRRSNPHNKIFSEKENTLFSVFLYLFGKISTINRYY